MVPIHAYHFPFLYAFPVLRFLPATCAIFSYLSSIFTCVSHPPITIFLIRCPPLPTISPVSVPTPCAADTCSLWAAAAVLPLHPGLQTGALPFFPVLAPTHTAIFLIRCPPMPAIFAVFRAHPCDDTCSLCCSRRTTRTPWTTGWSTTV